MSILKATFSGDAGNTCLENTDISTITTNIKKLFPIPEKTSSDKSPRAKPFSATDKPLRLRLEINKNDPTALADLKALAKFIHENELNIYVEIDNADDVRIKNYNKLFSHLFLRIQKKIKKEIFKDEVNTLLAQGTIFKPKARIREAKKRLNGIGEKKKTATAKMKQQRHQSSQQTTRQTSHQTSHRQRFIPKTNVENKVKIYEGDISELINESNLTSKFPPPKYEGADSLLWESLVGWHAKWLSEDNKAKYTITHATPEALEIIIKHPTLFFGGVFFENLPVGFELQYSSDMKMCILVYDKKLHPGHTPLSTVIHEPTQPIGVDASLQYFLDRDDEKQFETLLNDIDSLAAEEFNVNADAQMCKQIHSKLIKNIQNIDDFENYKMQFELILSLKGVCDPKIKDFILQYIGELGFDVCKKIGEKFAFILAESGPESLLIILDKIKASYEKDNEPTNVSPDLSRIDVIYYRINDSRKLATKEGMDNLAYLAKMSAEEFHLFQDLIWQDNTSEASYPRGKFNELMDAYKEFLRRVYDLTDNATLPPGCEFKNSRNMKVSLNRAYYILSHTKAKSKEGYGKEKEQLTLLNGLDVSASGAEYACREGYNIACAGMAIELNDIEKRINKATAPPVSTLSKEFTICYNTTNGNTVLDIDGSYSKTSENVDFIKSAIATLVDKDTNKEIYDKVLNKGIKINEIGGDIPSAVVNPRLYHFLVKENENGPEKNCYFLFELVDKEEDRFRIYYLENSLDSDPLIAKKYYMKMDGNETHTPVPFCNTPFTTPHSQTEVYYKTAGFTYLPPSLDSILHDISEKRLSWEELIIYYYRIIGTENHSAFTIEIYSKLAKAIEECKISHPFSRGADRKLFKNNLLISALLMSLSDRCENPLLEWEAFYECINNKNVIEQVVDLFNNLKPVLLQQIAKLQKLDRPAIKDLTQLINMCIASKDKELAYVQLILQHVEDYGSGLYELLDRLSKRNHTHSDHQCSIQDFNEGLSAIQQALKAVDNFTNNDFKNFITTNPKFNANPISMTSIYNGFARLICDFDLKPSSLREVLLESIIIKLCDLEYASPNLHILHTFFKIVADINFSKENHLPFLESVYLAINKIGHQSSHNDSFVSLSSIDNDNALEKILRINLNAQGIRFKNQEIEDNKDSFIPLLRQIQKKYPAFLEPSSLETLIGKVKIPLDANAPIQTDAKKQKASEATNRNENPQQKEGPIPESNIKSSSNTENSQALEANKNPVPSQPDQAVEPKIKKVKDYPSPIHFYLDNLFDSIFPNDTPETEAKALGNSAAHKTDKNEKPNKKSKKPEKEKKSQDILSEEPEEDSENKGLDENVSSSIKDIPVLVDSKESKETKDKNKVDKNKADKNTTSAPKEGFFKQVSRSTVAATATYIDNKLNPFRTALIGLANLIATIQTETPGLGNEANPNPPVTLDQVCDYLTSIKIEFNKLVGSNKVRALITIFGKDNIKAMLQKLKNDDQIIQLNQTDIDKLTELVDPPTDLGPFIMYIIDELFMRGMNKIISAELGLQGVKQTSLLNLCHTYYMNTMQSMSNEENYKNYILKGDMVFIHLRDVINQLIKLSNKNNPQMLNLVECMVKGKNRITDVFTINALEKTLQALLKLPNQASALFQNIIDHANALPQDTTIKDKEVFFIKIADSIEPMAPLMNYLDEKQFFTIWNINIKLISKNVAFPHHSLNKIIHLFKEKSLDSTAIKLVINTVEKTIYECLNKNADNMHMETLNQNLNSIISAIVGDTVNIQILNLIEFISSLEGIPPAESDNLLQQLLLSPTQQAILATLIKIHNKQKMDFTQCRDLLKTLTESAEKATLIMSLYNTEPYPKQIGTEEGDGYIQEIASLCNMTDLEELNNYIKNHDLDPCGKRMQTSKKDDKIETREQKIATQFDLGRTHELIAEIKNLLTDSSLTNSERERLVHQYLFIHQLGNDLINVSSFEIKRKAKAFIDIIRDPNKTPTDKEKAQLRLLALLREIIFRTRGDFPYPAQIIAVLNTLNNSGNVLMQIDTGEGKSLTTALLAIMQWAEGQTVDVCTATEDLVEQDYEKYKLAFDFLNIPSAKVYSDTSLPPDDKDPLPPQFYKVGGINYSTVGELSLYNAKAKVEGVSLKIRKLDPSSASDSEELKEKIQTDKNYYPGKKYYKVYDSSIILDESDFTFLDERNVLNYCANPLTSDENGNNPLYWVYDVINNIVDSEAFQKMDGDKAWSPEYDKSHTHQTLLEKAPNATAKEYLRKLITRQPHTIDRWIDAACDAAVKMKEENIEFTVEKETIKREGKPEEVLYFAQPMFMNVPQPGSTYVDGVQQFLHARLEKEHNEKEHKKTFKQDPEMMLVASETAKTFLRHYDKKEQKGNSKNKAPSRIIGITGTMGVRNEIQEQYAKLKATIVRIPPRDTNKRTMEEIVVANRAEQIRLIKKLIYKTYTAEEIKANPKYENESLLKAGDIRPALVVCENPIASANMFEALTGVKPVHWNALQSRFEKATDLMQSYTITKEEYATLKILKEKTFVEIPEITHVLDKLSANFENQLTDEDKDFLKKVDLNKLLKNPPQNPPDETLSAIQTRLQSANFIGNKELTSEEIKQLDKLQSINSDLDKIILKLSNNVKNRLTEDEARILQEVSNGNYRKKDINYIHYQYVDGTEGKEKREVRIKNAGPNRTVTVTTSLLGRGIDIKVDPAGPGLNGILTALFDKRTTDQVAGRAARNGQEGSFTAIYNDEDIIAKYGKERSLLRKGLFRISAEERAKQIKKIRERLEKEAAITRRFTEESDRIKNVILKQFNRWYAVIREEYANDPSLYEYILGRKEEMITILSETWEKILDDSIENLADGKAYADPYIRWHNGRLQDEELTHCIKLYKTASCELWNKEQEYITAILKKRCNLDIPEKYDDSFIKNSTDTVSIKFAILNSITNAASTLADIESTYVEWLNEEKEEAAQKEERSMEMRYMMDNSAALLRYGDLIEGEADSHRLKSAFYQMDWLIKDLYKAGILNDIDPSKLKLDKMDKASLCKVMGTLKEIFNLKSQPSDVNFSMQKSLYQLFPVFSSICTKLSQMNFFTDKNQIEDNIKDLEKTYSQKAMEAMLSQLIESLAWTQQKNSLGYKFEREAIIFAADEIYQQASKLKSKNGVVTTAEITTLIALIEKHKKSIQGVMSFNDLHPFGHTKTIKVFQTALGVMDRWVPVLTQSDLMLEAKMSGDYQFNKEKLEAWIKKQTTTNKIWLEITKIMQSLLAGSNYGFFDVVQYLSMCLNEYQDNKELLKLITAALKESKKIVQGLQGRYGYTEKGYEDYRVERLTHHLNELKLTHRPLKNSHLHAVHNGVNRDFVLTIETSDKANLESILGIADITSRTVNDDALKTLQDHESILIANIEKSAVELNALNKIREVVEGKKYPDALPGDIREEDLPTEDLKKIFAELKRLTTIKHNEPNPSELANYTFSTGFGNLQTEIKLVEEKINSLEMKIKALAKNKSSEKIAWDTDYLAQSKYEITIEGKKYLLSEVYQAYKEGCKQKNGVLKGAKDALARAQNEKELKEKELKEKELKETEEKAKQSGDSKDNKVWKFVKKSTYMAANEISKRVQKEDEDLKNCKKKIDEAKKYLEQVIERIGAKEFSLGNETYKFDDLLSPHQLEILKDQKTYTNRKKDESIENLKTEWQKNINQFYDDQKGKFLEKISSIIATQTANMAELESQQRFIRTSIKNIEKKTSFYKKTFSSVVELLKFEIGLIKNRKKITRTMSERSLFREPHEERTLRRTVSNDSLSSKQDKKTH